MGVPAVTVLRRGSPADGAVGTAAPLAPVAAVPSLPFYPKLCPAHTRGSLYGADPPQDPALQAARSHSSIGNSWNSSHSCAPPPQAPPAALWALHGRSPKATGRAAKRDSQPCLLQTAPRHCYHSICLRVCVCVCVWGGGDDSWEVLGQCLNLYLKVSLIFSSFFRFVMWVGMCRREKRMYTGGEGASMYGQKKK